MKKHLARFEDKAALAKQKATKSLGLKPFLDAKTRVKAKDVQALFRQKMAGEILNYEKKSLHMVAFLWLTTGLIGGHRYYLNRIGSGVAMAMTGGGFFFWWLVDGFRLKKMVGQFNTEQARREKGRLPPIGLEFLPSTNLEEVTRKPLWIKQEPQKMKSMLAYFSDVILLAFLGIALASITQSKGMLEPLISAVMIILVFLFFDKLMRYSHLPLIHELLHLEFKLRLFYTHNRPGNSLKLFFRPIFGLFIAPFDRHARNEVKLYLEVSGIFAIFLVAIKLLQTLLPGGFSGFSITGWAAGLLKMFLIIYMVTSPIGAVMTKHVLIGTSRFKVIILGAMTLLAILLQLVSRI